MTDSTLFLNNTQNKGKYTLPLTFLSERTAFCPSYSIFSKPEFKTKYFAKASSANHTDFVVLL